MAGGGNRLAPDVAGPGVGPLRGGEGAQGGPVGADAAGSLPAGRAACQGPAAPGDHGHVLGVHGMRCCLFPQPDTGGRDLGFGDSSVGWRPQK